MRSVDLPKTVPGEHGFPAILYALPAGYRGFIDKILGSGYSVKKEDVNGAFK
jgi:hypothetical protein